jgi:hypothetical protein
MMVNPVRAKMMGRMQQKLARTAATTELATNKTDRFDSSGLAADACITGSQQSLAPEPLACASLMTARITSREGRPSRRPFSTQVRHVIP